MKPVPLSMVCAAVLALSAPAQAAGPADGPTVLAQLIHTPHGTTQKRMAGRVGQRGIRTVGGTVPKMTRQDIADEKKLQQDMHICDGC